MPPTPLPKANSPEVVNALKEHPNHLSAYNMCLNYESEHANANSEHKLRHVRILGFLLLHAPKWPIRVQVSKCIHSRKNASDLSDVGEFFERHVILIFKKYRGRTPQPSSHPSRPSCEVTKEQVKVDIKEAPKDHKAAKALALRRDNWKCVVTGFVDRGAPQNIGAGGVHTQCAHIIPESTLFGVDPQSQDTRKHEYSAAILAILSLFGYNIEKFNGEKIHSLTNVMSMDPNVHDLFDRLELYFESTSVENTYAIKLFGGELPYLNPSKLVTFTTLDPVNLPVPSRELLDLHATCCKVAHFSGAAEYIDTIYRDADEMDVLSADGASGDMLNYLLSSASQSIVNVQG